MSAFTEFSFATLDQLKRRLNIATTDYDQALTEALRFSSAAIERAAGRRLRRFPAKTERFTGGGKLIRLSVSPIARVHYLRESYDRNFSDSSLYTELVQDTDYVMDTDFDGEIPGSSGILRRINGCWAGSIGEPGTIEARYTGGYKTDDETVLENKEIILSEASRVQDFEVQRVGAGTPSPYYEITGESATELRIETDTAFPRYRPIFFVDVSSLLNPTWGIIVFKLEITAKLTSGTRDLTARIMATNGLSNNLSALFDAVATGTQLGDTYTLSSMTFVPVTFIMTLDTTRSAIESTIADGHITIGIDSPNSGAFGAVIRSMDEPDPALRPKITIKHRPGPSDPFVMEDDLRVANLIQAAHDHYIRSSPGALFEAQRGVAIASGSTVQKKEAGLLPYVLDIARRYRRLY